MFNENSFIDAISTLKLQVINPSYLKNVRGGKAFAKLIHL